MFITSILLPNRFIAVPLWCVLFPFLLHIGRPAVLLWTVQHTSQLTSAWWVVHFLRGCSCRINSEEKNTRACPTETQGYTKSCELRQNASSKRFLHPYTRSTLFSSYFLTFTNIRMYVPLAYSEACEYLFLSQHFFFAPPNICLSPSLSLHPLLWVHASSARLSYIITHMIPTSLSLSPVLYRSFSPIEWSRSHHNTAQEQICGIYTHLNFWVLMVLWLGGYYGVPLDDLLEEGRFIPTVVNILLDSLLVHCTGVVDLFAQPSPEIVDEATVLKDSMQKSMLYLFQAFRSLPSLFCLSSLSLLSLFCLSSLSLLSLFCLSYSAPLLLSLFCVSVCFLERSSLTTLLLQTK